ncbi:MAG: PIN domain-containing protein [Myxococcota bacterium]
MKRKITIYLDTSVISALFDERKADRMFWTQEFWRFIKEFEIYISDLVIAEIQETPDPELRRKMLEAVKGFNILEFNEEAEWLGREYVAYGAIPERYRRDAFHLSIATVSGIDIILS